MAPTERPLVVAANRLPLTRAEDGSWTTSPGGLVRALLPTVQETKGSWVGWTGERDGPSEVVRADGIDPGLLHASNSAALWSTLGEHFTMVRIGLALLGLNPGNFALGDAPVRPVLSLRSQIVFLKDMPEDASVGYNRTFVTRRPTRLVRTGATSGAIPRPARPAQLAGATR